MPKQIKLSRCELGLINDALAQPLSEVVNLPKACYTNEFDIKVCSIRALLLVKGEAIEIEYKLKNTIRD